MRLKLTITLVLFALASYGVASAQWPWGNTTQSPGQIPSAPTVCADSGTMTSGAVTIVDNCIRATMICVCSQWDTGSAACGPDTPLNGSVVLHGTGSAVVNVICAQSTNFKPQPTPTSTASPTPTSTATPTPTPTHT